MISFSHLTAGHLTAGNQRENKRLLTYDSTIMPRSLTSRPADLGYVSFLLFHLLASLLVDGQSFYPPHLVPASLKQVKADYLRDSKDPLISNAFSPRYAWFTLALVTEMVIQVPSFLLGAIGLIRGESSVSRAPKYIWDQRT